MHVQNQCTPLYIASSKGFNEVVKSLIAANANVNCICKVRELLYASQFERIHVCTYAYIFIGSVHSTLHCFG